jgi:hypothetical protein
MKKCKKSGCLKDAEPGSNFCHKHDLDGQGVRYLKEDSPELKSDDPSI